jgi:hypothetical protein
MWFSPCSGQAEQFRSFFVVKPRVPAIQPLVPSSHAGLSQESLADTESDNEVVNQNPNAICWGYLSDQSSEDGDINWADNEDDSPGLGAASELTKHPSSSQNIILPPKSKRRKLDVPARTVKEQAKEAHLQELRDALHDIKKLIVSKKTQFAGGANGLQSKRARSIQSCLHMVIDNN